jgi:hypothetical protein
MKNRRQQSKYLLLKQLMWKKRVNRKYLPHAGYMGNGDDIHLILGVNGVSISHLTQLLSQALPDNHYIHNPLVKFEPGITLSHQGDRLAVPYQKELAADHPLNRVYRFYAERGQGRTGQNILDMEAESAQDRQLILKESHGLLATEALIRELKCHMLLYVGDPVIIAEQLFAREGFDTPYLDLESESVMDLHFLRRFFKHNYRAVLHAYKLIQRLPSTRQRMVQNKILTITLIQHKFRMLAVRYPELASVVDFSLVEKDPRRLVFPLRNWLGPNSMEHVNSVLSTATFTPNGQAGQRWIRSWPESISTFEALTAKDVKLAYQLLMDHELMRDEGMTETLPVKLLV